MRELPNITGGNGRQQSPSLLHRKGLLLTAAVMALAGASCGSADSPTADSPTTGQDSAQPTTPPDDTITSSTSGSGDTDPEQEGLTIAWWKQLTSFDPQRGNSGGDYHYLFTVYDTLIVADPTTQEPTPGLATSWELPDPTTLVLQLREGVEFHDGTPFNAAAVVANIDRALSEDSGIKGDLASIDKVEATGDFEITIHTTSEDSSLIGSLSDRAGMMMSPAALQDPAIDISREPVGTGPYQLVEWQTGDRVVVEKFDRYWDDDPGRVHRLTFVPMDPPTALNALRTGQIDMTFEPPLQDVPAFESDSGFTVSVSQKIQLANIYLNASIAPFDDYNVRAAINHAVDREALVEATLFGYGAPAWTMFPEGYWAYPADLVPTFPHDVERARQLLADAGYEDGGPAITLNVYATSTDIRRGEVLAAQLGEAGFDVEVVPTELTQLVDEFYAERKHGTLVGNWSGRPDPSLMFASLFMEGGFYNPTGTTVDGLGEAVAAANATTDLEERAAHFADASKALVDTARIVPLVFPDDVVIFTSNVSGYQPDVSGKPRLTNLELD